jgi:hypothetical protein
MSHLEPPNRMVAIFFRFLDMSTTVPVTAASTVKDFPCRDWLLGSTRRRTTAGLVNGGA